MSTESQQQIDPDANDGYRPPQIAQPQPTTAGKQEWTPDWLANFGSAENWLEQVCDAHNAALREYNNKERGWGERMTKAQLLKELAAERQRREQARNPHDVIKLRASDAMARIVDDMVERKLLDSRSALADARLDYGEPFKYLEHDEHQHDAEVRKPLVDALQAIMDETPPAPKLPIIVAICAIAADALARHGGLTPEKEGK